MKRTWKWCNSLFAGLLAVSGIACTPKPEPSPAPTSTEVEEEAGSSSRSLDLDLEIENLKESAPVPGDRPARVRSG